MSEENVEVVQAAWAAWERNGLAGFTEYWADDIDWQAIGGRWRGKDAGRAYLQELVGSFDEFTPEYFAVVNEVRNGKMVTGREYATREEALEAAGLSEWAMSEAFLGRSGAK